MASIDDIKTKLGEEEIKLTPLSNEEILEIRGEYPSLPQEYFDFLSEIGWGDLGIYIYSGPGPAKELYQSIPSIDCSYISIGDDGMGNVFAYKMSTESCKLVDIGLFGEIHEVEENLLNFIYSWL